LALEAIPGAAVAAGAPGVTPGFTTDDLALFRGLLQHVDEAAIRATCQATGSDTPEAVAARVSALTDKLRAAAAPMAAPVVPTAPAGTAASIAADATEELEMDFDTDESEQLERLLEEFAPAGATAAGSLPAARAEAKRRLVQHTARLVSRRVKDKRTVRD
jgi:hypothetical protein